MRNSIIASAMLLLLSACGQLPAERASPTTVPAVPTAIAAPTAPAPTSAPAAGNELSAEQEHDVMRRFAAQLGVEPATLKLLSAELVEWNDGSLGCPSPNAVYTQALVQGYRITISDANKQYLIHTDNGGDRPMTMIWCDNGTPVMLSPTADGTPNEQAASAPTPPAKPAQTPKIVLPTVEVVLPNATPPPVRSSAPANGAADAIVTRVQEEVATITGVATAQQQVVSVEEVEWSDSSLGCPSPNGMYLQVITPGYRIVVEANGAQYDYHTDLHERMVLCNGQGPRSRR